MSKIRVTPEELGKVAQVLVGFSNEYTELYKQLFQVAGTMGEAWESADNLAFVDQINGFCEELKAMAQRLSDDAVNLDKQKENYNSRLTDNITQVRKLAN